MNTLERRITDALRAYGEGLDMTAKDIDRLEQELEPRQEAHRQQRRNRIWQAAVAACAVTGVVLGALALRGDPEPPKVPTGPPAQTTKGLEGIWLLNDGSGYLWTFSVDGKLRYTNQPYDPRAHGFIGGAGIHLSLHSGWLHPGWQRRLRRCLCSHDLGRRTTSGHRHGDDGEWLPVRSPKGPQRAS